MHCFDKDILSTELIVVYSVRFNKVSQKDWIKNQNELEIKFTHELVEKEIKVPAIYVKFENEFYFLGFVGNKSLSFPVKPEETIKVKIFDTRYCETTLVGLILKKVKN